MFYIWLAFLPIISGLRLIQFLILCRIPYSITFDFSRLYFSPFMKSSTLQSQECLRCRHLLELLQDSSQLKN